MSEGGRQNWYSVAACCAILVAAALACPIIGHAKGRIISPTTTGTIAFCTVTITCTPGQFGYSMATNAGTSSVPAGSVLVIGAPASGFTVTGVSGSTSYNDVGVALVFVEPPGGWGASLPPPFELVTPSETGTPVKNAKTGYSVAINSDGTVIVVGAPGDNGYINTTQTTVTDAGAAWVFTNTSWPAPGSVTEDHELTAPDGVSGDQFGDSVAISPSGDTIVVGAPDHSAGVGAAYVFTTSLTTPLPPTWNSSTSASVSETILTSGSTSAGYFGTSVAISGDANAANSATSSAIFVGAPSGGASASGVVDVFEGTSWGTTSAISDPANASNDQFGASAAIAGTTAVVGAPNTVGAAAVQDVGAAYVFTESATGWATAATLTASGATNGSLLGTSVAISSDGSVVVAGAPGAPPASSNTSFSQGTMYQFDEPAKGPNLLGWSSENESDTFEFSKSSLSSQDNIGASAAVEISGRNTLVYAGAPGAVSTDPGAAYIFQGK